MVDPSLAEARVHSLMKLDEQVWDGDVIHEIFCSRDADLILGIPLRDSSNNFKEWLLCALSRGSICNRGVVAIVGKDMSAASLVIATLAVTLEFLEDW
ncbi:hypothetical protein DITRI_Ditri15bG0087500 [Diplodiscus trichospermus]